MKTDYLKTSALRLAWRGVSLCLGAALLLAGGNLLMAQEQAPSGPDRKEPAVSSEELQAPVKPEPGENDGAGNRAQPLTSAEILTFDNNSKAGSALYPASSMMTLLKNIFIFIILVLVLYFSLKGFGKLSRFRSGKAQSINFLMRGVMPLDNRKYLAAVEVDGRLLIIGVSQDRINKLAQWPLNSDAGFVEDHSDFQEEFKDTGDVAADHGLDISIVDDEDK